MTLALPQKHSHSHILHLAIIWTDPPLIFLNILLSITFPVVILTHLPELHWIQQSLTHSSHQLYSGIIPITSRRGSLCLIAATPPAGKVNLAVCTATPRCAPAPVTSNMGSRSPWRSVEWGLTALLTKGLKPL